MGIVIAGVSSGSGKTTLTIGLMRSLKDRGLKVGAFKAGPDYIDPMFHRMAIDDCSYNLPSWMIEDSTLRYLYQKRSEDKDISIVEGVMGYFDGHSADSILGSTAHLANAINEGVLLIMDASSMALTSAAIINGLVTFHQPTAIKGVIFNKIRSKMHYDLLKSCVETHTPVKCFGYLMPADEIQLESRHLGLVQASEDQAIESKIVKMKELVEATVQVDEILAKFSNRPFDVSESICIESERVGENSEELYRNEKIKQTLNNCKDLIEQSGGLRLGIAKDQAFSFYYDENLETLRELGVELIPFSPLKDSKVPEECDALYLGGGYPEVFSKELEANSLVIQSIQSFAKQGKPIYAECGGLMYLTDKIVDLSGNQCFMTGILGGISTMTEKLQRFGHVEATIDPYTLLNRNNDSGVHEKETSITYRGHEFHHSLVLECPQQTLLTVNKNQKSWKCGYVKNRVFATYVHFHFYSELKMLEALIQFFLSK